MMSFGFTLLNKYVSMLLLLVYGCSSEQDLEEYLKTPLTIAGRNIPLEEFYLGGIVFDNPTAYSTGVPHNISYTIR